MKKTTGPVQLTALAVNVSFCQMRRSWFHTIFSLLLLLLFHPFSRRSTNIKNTFCFIFIVLEFRPQNAITTGMWILCNYITVRAHRVITMSCNSLIFLYLHKQTGTYLPIRNRENWKTLWNTNAYSIKIGGERGGKNRHIYFPKTVS